MPRLCIEEAHLRVNSINISPRGQVFEERSDVMVRNGKKDSGAPMQED